jgi:hypothetical protein
MSTTGSRVPQGETDVGFNAMRPGKVKAADLVMLVSAIVVIVALVIWAIR